MAGENTLNPSVWFREIILPQIEQTNKVDGDYLNGTMMPADEEAVTIKFPIMSGKFQMYKLTGGITPIQSQTLGLTCTPVQPDDFEAAGYLRVQDLNRVGPAMQAAFAKEMSKAVARKKDTIKLDALSAFMSVTTPPADLGDANMVIDPLLVLKIGALIAGVGYKEPIFMPISEMDMAQLCLYKEFANADWVGPDLPLAKMNGITAKTYKNVNLFTLPDEYFTNYSPDGGTSNYTWAWCKSALGAHAGNELRNPTFVPQPQLEGTPFLAKVNITGAAIGINPNGVKRIRLKKLTDLTRPT